MPTQQSKTYALLVGVDNYRAYDRRGSKDLPGSANDVVAWRSVLLRRGYAPENIRMLVSVAPEAAETSRVAGALPATRANIQREVAWLAEQLADKEQAAGVFTFSGHGDIDEEGVPVLCPTDTEVEEGHLRNVLSLEHLIHKLPRNATVVLDCCHSGPPLPPAPAATRGEKAQIPAGTALVLSLRQRPATSLQKDVYRARMPAARVLSATSLAGVAFQTEVGGRFHGALTWALTSLLGQWRATPGSPPSVTLSCHAARAHVESLFAALGLPQSSTLYGTSVMEEALAKRIPLLGRGIEGRTIEMPDGPLVPLQFPVDLKVWIGTDMHLPITRESGVISAVGYVPPEPFQRNKEYWRLGNNLLADIANGAEKLHFAVDTSTSPPRWEDITTNPPNPLFWMDLVPEWEDSSAPAGKGYYSNDTEPPVAVFIALRAPQSTTESWSGQITWYRVLPPGASLGTPVFGSQGRSLDLQDQPPEGTETLHWQKVVLPPHQI